MKILAVSGSVRAASINTAFLRAVAQLAPSDIQVVMYEGMGALPIFNPDLEAAPPEQVVQWHALIAQADAVLIASPEYAHGVTGAVKNALDWLVSYTPFVNKPVAVVNTSARAHHADDALRETLVTMNAKLVASASITVPLLGANLSLQCLAQAPVLVDATAHIVDGLRKAVTSMAA
jgi:chromate reductase